MTAIFVWHREGVDGVLTLTSGRKEYLRVAGIRTNLGNPDEAYWCLFGQMGILYEIHKTTGKILITESGGTRAL